MDVLELPLSCHQSRQPPATTLVSFKPPQVLVCATKKMGERQQPFEYALVKFDTTASRPEGAFGEATPSQPRTNLVSCLAFGHPVQKKRLMRSGGWLELECQDSQPQSCWLFITRRKLWPGTRTSRLAARKRFVIDQSGKRDKLIGATSRSHPPKEKVVLARHSFQSAECMFLIVVGKDPAAAAIDFSPTRNTNSAIWLFDHEW